MFKDRSFEEAPTLMFNVRLFGRALMLASIPLTSNNFVLLLKKVLINYFEYVKMIFNQLNNYLA